MKRYTSLVLQFWRPALIGLAIAVVTFFILFMHLGSRPASLSAPEALTRSQSRSLHSIWKNPVNAPLTIPEHFAIHLRPHGVAASRITVAIFGVLALILFFGIVRFWQNTFTAVVGTIIFGSSSWFLHVSRLDVPDVLLFGVLGLLACGLWLKHTLHRNVLLLVAAAAIATAFYIPGLIWFVVGGIIGTKRTILHELHHIKRSAKTIALLLGAAMLVPIGWAIGHTPRLAWTVLGLPEHWPRALQLLKNLGGVPVHLFIRGPVDPVRWLGHMPLLDAFEIAMLILGAYAFWHYRQLDRVRLLVGWALIGILLISSGGPVNLTILLPLLYIVIAAGVFYMLETWFKVFPNNPVARAVGLIILLSAVAISCWFQYSSYFVAWQHAPDTHAVFTERPAKL